MSDNQIYGAELDEVAAATLPLGKGGATTLLDELREAAQEEISNLVTFSIENRKGDWRARFDAVIGESDVKRYRRAAMGKKTKPEDADLITANGMALVEKCTGLFKGGDTENEQVFDGDGDPLTFASEEFLAMFPGNGTAAQKLAQFLGDAQLKAMGEGLYKAAGYGRDLEPLDPTDG